MNTCVIAYFKTGYTKRQNKIDFVAEIFPVFRFPAKNADLNKKWIKFVNRKDWAPPKHNGICSKHFEAKFLKVGQRTT